MGKKTHKDLWKMISWSVMLSILLSTGCAILKQPESSPPEPPKETSKTVEPISRPQSVDQEPALESSRPPESPPAPPQPQVIETVLPQPYMIGRVLPQPEVIDDVLPELRGVEKTEQPPSGRTEKTISEDFILLNPAVPQDARTIQTRLAELGFYQGPIDGIWGRGSGKALMAFKEKNSLGSSDKWNEEVQMFLFRETSQADQPPLDPTQKLISSGLVLLNPSVPEDTKKIQTRLAELGLYSGAIDGIWGKGSQAGLKSFKKRQSLKNPDKWDKETQLLLFRETHP